MVTITEEPEEEQPQKPEPQPRQKLRPNPTVKPTNHSQSQSSSSNPFVFWCYFTVSISLITLFCVFLSSFSSQDPKSWFLSLPSSLREHYSKGRIIKVQTVPDSGPVEVFAIENGPPSAENVLLVHGLGASSYSFKSVIESLGSKGVHAVAIDLPGSGFSDKTIVVEEEVEIGALGRFWDVYGEIQEKGIFWAFDQIVETGQMPYQELQNPQFSRRKISKPLELGSEEMGKVLSQVIQTMRLTRLHLVLHDSAFSMSAYWILNNLGSLKSVTLIDASTKPALPLWVLQVPLVREGVLGISQLYERLIGLNCVKGNGGILDAEAHRVLLRGRDGGRAVLEMARKLNHTFDVAEWGGSEELKSIRMQVLWSSGCSEEHSKEGQRISHALPQAKFVAHSSGRWPQEGSADELARNIFQLVSSLAEPIKHAEEEPLPEQIEKSSDKASGGDHSHQHSHDIHHHHHGHGHPHMAGYMDAYGLDHGWAA